MTAYEKKRKAAMIAVAYYIEQEKAEAAAAEKGQNIIGWTRTAKEIAMGKRQLIQRRGRVLRRA